MTTRFKSYCFISSLILISFIYSLWHGTTNVSFSEVWSNPHSQDAFILFQFRLPRTLTAFISGGLLALAGALMQVLVQNPLADPYVLGISGGAAFCTLLLMYLGLNPDLIIIAAWIGALISMFLIFSLSHKHRWEKSTLLLSGIAISCGFQAGISCLLILSSNTNLHSMLFWLMGDISDATFSYAAAVLLLTALFISCLIAPGLNVLVRGGKEAQALGLRYRNYRIALFLIASLCTATAVTLVGCIGFVGLIVPHISRSLTGFDHRRVIPLTVILGGSLVMTADTFARTLFSPQQIPVGIIMSCIGIPVFIWLLKK